jgi:branched-chain amino acid transport system substrate-binding protein
MNSHRLSRRAASVFAVIGTVVMLAACGSSSNKSASKSGGSSSGASTSAATPSGPAGAAINLGSICSCSGAQSSQLGSLKQVSQAWADSVNAAGGINGHKVNLTVLDDAGNPATALQDAKQLVQQDHVIALVGDDSLADASFASYIASQGVPVVGGISPEATFLSNPDFYPSGSQLIVQTVGTIALAKTAGKSHIGVLYCAESPICAQLVPLAQGAAALSGLKISTAKVSSTAPSYTSECLSLKSDGVDALFVGAASPVVQRVTAACAQQGYTPQTTNQTSTASNSWLTDSSLQGAVLAGYNANPFDTTTPAVQAFRTALDKYAPGLLTSSQFNFDDIDPWAAGKLFEAAAKAANITPSSTAADVKKGLYALKNETLGGLAAPLNFTAGKPAFIPCYFTASLKSGKFVSLNSNQPTCLTAAQTSSLLKALHLA